MKTKRCTLLLISLMVSWALAAPHQSLEKPADYQPPQTASHYDWRHTHWFGVSFGTTTGSGLSYRYWGKENGWQFTLLPFASSDQDFLLATGMSRLFSLNHPPAASPSMGGFTGSPHFYWYASTAHGYYQDNDMNESSYLGTLAVGFGVDLNRRASRYTLMLGLGPYLGIHSGSDYFLRFFPTFEMSWHFGSPNRSTP